MTQQASRKPVFPPEIAPYIDVGAYLLDARAPASTLYLDQLLLGKELLLLTRAGLAEGKLTRRWVAFLKEAGYPCLAIDSLTGEGIEEVLDYLADLLRRKTALVAKHGVKSATLRVAALGVPNVGKSTFLNKLIGRKRLRVGDRPGITRGMQWIRLFEDVEVLDTPGILRDPTMLRRRKPCWQVLNLMPYDPALREESVTLLMEHLGERNARQMEKLYKLAGGALAGRDWIGVLELIARRGGYTLEADGMETAARRLLRDFQLGRFGRLTLEEPSAEAITSPYFGRGSQAG